MKTFSSKQVFILVLVIVAGISFAETSEPIRSLSFLREFGLKFLMYGLVSEFIVIILGSSTKIFKD